MADKKTYYVSVGPGEIVDSQEEISFEFEVLATDEEIDKLQQLFEERDKADLRTHVRAEIPYKEYHFDKENDLYDYELREIYKLIHELGNEKTRQHIESMNILQ